MKIAFKTRKQYCCIFAQAMIASFIILSFVVAHQLFVNDDLLLGSLGLTSFASTVYIAFLARTSPMASERRIIMSYLLAITIGVACHYALKYFAACTDDACRHVAILTVIAPIAALLLIIVSALFSFEHAPAIGVAIGFAISQFNLALLILLMVSIIIMCGIKKALKSWLVCLE